MGGDLQSPPMGRTRIATVLVGVLIAASAVAFLRAEHLKLERSPVAKPSIQKYFSATCTAGSKSRRSGPRATRSPTTLRWMPATKALCQFAQSAWGRAIPLSLVAVAKGPSAVTRPANLPRAATCPASA
jgi:hypothetical protein